MPHSPYQRLMGSQEVSEEIKRGLEDIYLCRHFDISPKTFYRGKRRYNPRHIASLEDRSHQPRHLRRPTCSAELVEAVLKLRKVVQLVKEAHHRDNYHSTKKEGGK